MITKRIFIRPAPDAAKAEYCTSVGSWHPFAGQEIAIGNTVHGQGWYVIESVTVMLSGMTDHMNMAAISDGNVFRVQEEEMEVVLIPRDPTQIGPVPATWASQERHRR